MASTRPRLSAPIVEHRQDGFGVAHARPRLSWRFAQPEDGSSADGQDWVQYTYELEIKHGGGPPATFCVDNSQSVLVPWPAAAAPLASRDTAAVRVRAYGRNPLVWPQPDRARDVTEWSGWTAIEATLLAREDWTAGFIASPTALQQPNSPLRPVRFRKVFASETTDAVVKARLYVTCYGAYRAFLNGQRIGDHVLAPGWTSFHHRLVFHTYDVTDLLAVPGSDNLLSAEVAEGWYAGRLGVRGGKRYIWGDTVALLAQLEVTYASGAVHTVRTDDSWQSSASATLTAEIYHGEVYDMRLEDEAWTSRAAEPQAAGLPSWTGVKTLPFTTAVLVAPDSPPIRVVEEVAPVKVFTSPAGKTLIDFGQNLVGVLRVKNLALAAGTNVTLYHGEVVDKDGELARTPLRQAECRDVIIGSGAPLAEWQPSYTFHGFRFVQVDGLGDALPQPAQFTACVLHSDMTRRGWFECSDPMLNRLHENTVWGVRGNMLCVPTDCPQRDERLGWTGDLQIITPSMAFVYDCTSTVASWLQDVAAEQLAKDNGIPGSAVPDVLPDTWASTPQAVWHDVVVLTPWDLYCTTGDAGVMAAQYESMRAWIDKGVRRGPDGLWDPDLWQLGDWLDPAAPYDDPGRGLTEGVFVADSYLVRATTLLARASAVLGHTAEAAAYAADAARLKATWQHKYVTPAGHITNHTQTALALALQFDLAPGDARGAVSAALARLVQRDCFRVTTGLVGTSLIAPALTAAGHSPLAYRMLAERQCPSFLYPLTMGATTVWERWNSMLPYGSVNTDPMTSFNHYALGSIARWLHNTVAGLSSADGWRTVDVRPVPGGELTHASARFDGPFGLVSASWMLVPAGNGHQDTAFELALTVPPNSKARVVLPGATVAESGPRTVGSGKHTFRCRYEAAPWPPRSFLPFFRPEGFTWKMLLSSAAPTQPSKAV